MENFDNNAEADIEVTKETVASTIDKTSSLGDLTEKEYSIIKSKSGWLDGMVIHQAQLCLKKMNSNIEGFQRPILGPVRNFDLISGEFIQVLHTGRDHWVCISSIGCLKGHVTLHDSLFNDIISDEVEEQTKCLLGDA